MAGIGFELKKLFRKKGSYVDTVKAYSISAIVTEGPMLLSIFMIFILKFLIAEFNGSYKDQEIFFTTITYIMIFSMIISNIFIMFITRYISDCIFNEKMNLIVPAFYGVSCLILILGGIMGGIYIFSLNIGIMFKLTAFIQFSIVLIVWEALAFLSAIKQYTRILKGFFKCVCIAVTISILFMLLKIDPLMAALAGSTVGYFYMLVVFVIQINDYYPKGERGIFKFIGALDEYKVLVIIGFSLTLGLYCHNFVMWTSEYKIAVLDRMVYCMIYDVPAFYACMTLLPMLVKFVVSLETNFYEAYRNYFDLILYGGRLQDIEASRENMTNILFREMSRMVEIQMFFAIVAVVFIGRVLQILGFDNNMIGIFRTLCFGYCFFGLVRCLIIILLYFDDRIGACISSVLFTAASIILSIITLNLGIEYYGLGFLGAGFFAAIYSLFRLRSYIVELDYNVFCKQPLFYREEKGRFTKVMEFINKKMG